MSELYLRQPRFIYSACRSFSKNKKRIQIFKERGESKYIYQSKLDKASFKHDLVYGDFKDLPRRTAFDKLLHDKIYNIAKNEKYDGYQRCFASLVYKPFDKKHQLVLPINLLMKVIIY